LEVEHAKVKIQTHNNMGPASHAVPLLRMLASGRCKPQQFPPLSQPCLVKKQVLLVEVHMLDSQDISLRMALRFMPGFIYAYRIPSQFLGPLWLARLAVLGLGWSWAIMAVSIIPQIQPA
jgi:hypothetical protein